MSVQSTSNQTTITQTQEERSTPSWVSVLKRLLDRSGKWFDGNGGGGGPHVPKSAKVTKESEQKCG